MSRYADSARDSLMRAYVLSLRLLLHHRPAHRGRHAFHRPRA